MTSHPEHDLLSAYADGESDARERAVLEAHLSSCGEARAVLGAIRATLDDLALMDEPQMDPQVSFAIRGAVARERKLSGRGRRYGWATGAAAAALIGVVAFMTFGPERGTVDGVSGGTSAPQAFSDENYTKGTVGAVLDELAAEYGPGSAKRNDTTAAAPAADSGAGTEVFSAESADQNFAECLTTIERESDSARLVRSLAARFEGNAVYLLMFEVPAKNPKRLELWVVSRGTCDIRYFTQESLS